MSRPLPSPSRWATALLSLLPVCVPPALAQSSKPLPDYPIVPTGSVSSIATVGDTVYVAGSFQSVGSWSGGLLRTDPGVGSLDPAFPKVIGTVHVIVPDGVGGHYIGGLFTKVGGLPRTNLARIRGDGRVAAWSASTNGGVYSLALRASTLYLGGVFSMANGQARASLAAVDTMTGSLLPWNPGANSFVYGLGLVGNSVYVGGVFTTLGPQPRNRLGSVDATSGAVTAWNPNADGDVYTLAVSPTTVYVSGFFGNVGGQARSRLAALDPGTGLATAWNPAPTSYANAIVPAGSTIYAGGGFTAVGGQPRNRIAALDATSGAALAWNPNADGTVLALAVSGSTVYAGGSFTTVGGQSRTRAAALDASTAAVLPWDPGVTSYFSEQVRALHAGGGSVVVGGSFQGAGQLGRRNFFAFDEATGAVKPWNPDADFDGYSIYPDGSLVYIGGAFSNVGGQPRTKIAAVDAVSGAPTSWAPSIPSGAVNAVVTTPGVVTVGGNFNMVDGQSRYLVAGLDSGTAALLPWPAGGPFGLTYSLAQSGAALYAGGVFGSIGGLTRNNLAQFDPITGVASAAWNPNPNGTVFSLVPSGTTLYAAGGFTTIGGQPRGRIAQLDVATGLSTSWTPAAANNNVLSLALAPGKLLLAGSFSVVGGAARFRLAAIDASTGAVLPWGPAADFGVNVVTTSAKRVFVGGGFETIGGEGRLHLAAFCLAEAPTGLVATPAGDNRIDLSWTPTGAPGYNVYRSLTAGGPYALLGTSLAPAFSDTSADGGVTFYYVVRAVDGCESDPSNEASASTTGACALPPAFDGVAAAAAVTAPTCSVQLSWAAAAPHCGSGVLYSVHRDTDSTFLPGGGNRIASGLAGLSFLDDVGVLPGVTYYYVVRAAESGAADDNLVRAAATATSCGASPSPLRHLSATAFKDSNVLEWRSQVGPFQATRIHRTVASPSCAFETDPMNPASFVGSVPGLADQKGTFADTSVANGTTYCYSAFAEAPGPVYAAPRFVAARPFDNSAAEPEEAVRWAYSSGATSVAPPGIGGAAVYILSNDHVVHAAERGPGGGLWPAGFTPLALNGPAQSRPPIVPFAVGPATSVLFVGSQDGRVTAMDAATGMALWQTNVGQPVQAGPAGIFTSFGAAYSYVLVGTRDAAGANRFLALDPATGDVLEAFDNGGGANAMGIISGGAAVDYTGERVYFASRRKAGGSSDTVWCLKLSATAPRLTPLWSSDIGDVDGSPVLRGGRLYVGNSAGVHALDAASGLTAWTFPTAGEGAKGFVFPDRGSNDLYVATTSKVWGIVDGGASATAKWPEVSLPSTSILLWAPGTPRLYVGGGTGELFELDQTFATPTLSPTMKSVLVGGGGAVLGAASLDALLGLVYVGSDRGVIYAITAPLP